MARVDCTACYGLPQSVAKYCHECRGIGYLDRRPKDDTCTHKRPECPIISDPMVHGWDCPKCGRSGPMPKDGTDPTSASLPTTTSPQE